MACRRCERIVKLFRAFAAKIRRGDNHHVTANAIEAICDLIEDEGCPQFKERTDGE